MAPNYQPLRCEYPGPRPILKIINLRLLSRQLRPDRSLAARRNIVPAPNLLAGYALYDLAR